MHQASMQRSDVTFVDRQDARTIISIPGNYSLASRRDGRGNRREFACRAVSMSARSVVIAAPVLGHVGERVIAHIGPVGRLEGKVLRNMELGFVMSITASEAEQARLTRKIAWIEKHKNHETLECREHDRIVPEDPHSTLTLADGSRRTCLVIDMSVSGAAVSADLVPKLGTPLALGRVVGRVVRHFDQGFAIQFVTPQRFATLEHMLIRR
ncbi:MAG: PilZ domain-containing protein [Xanthobacteraceae bacterium]|jgi:hypothetical protein